MKKKKRKPNFSNIRINETEYKLIKALLWFRKRKKSTQAEELESNLSINFYEDKIKNKYNKYEIIRDWKREDGWMDYIGLSNQTDINKVAVSSKIERLIMNGIVDSTQIEWRHYKNKGKLGTKYVYRLNPSIETLTVLSELLDDKQHLLIKEILMKMGFNKEDDIDNITSDILVLARDRDNFLVNSDYFNLVPQEVKSEWVKEAKIRSAININIAQKKYNRYVNLFKKINKEAKVKKS